MNGFRVVRNGLVLLFAVLLVGPGGSVAGVSPETLPSGDGTQDEHEGPIVSPGCGETLEVGDWDTLWFRGSSVDVAGGAQVGAPSVQQEEDEGFGCMSPSERPSGPVPVMHAGSILSNGNHHLPITLRTAPLSDNLELLTDGIITAELNIGQWIVSVTGDEFNFQVSAVNGDTEKVELTDVQKIGAEATSLFWNSQESLSFKDDIKNGEGSLENGLVTIENGAVIIGGGAQIEFEFWGDDSATNPTGYMYFLLYDAQDFDSHIRLPVLDGRADPLDPLIEDFYVDDPDSESDSYSYGDAPHSVVFTVETKRDVSEVRIDPDDGSEQIPATESAPGEWTAEYTYTELGGYQPEANVFDEDGGSSDTAKTIVLVGRDNSDEQAIADCGLDFWDRVEDWAGEEEPDPDEVPEPEELLGCVSNPDPDPESILGGRKLVFVEANEPPGNADAGETWPAFKVQIVTDDDEGETSCTAGEEIQISAEDDTSWGDGQPSAEVDNGENCTATFDEVAYENAGAIEFTWSVVDDSDVNLVKEITVTPGPADAGESDIDADDSSIQAGEDTTITVTLKDEFGNELESGGETVCLSTTLGGFDQSSGDCGGDGGFEAEHKEGGDYTATFTSEEKGTATIEATFDGDSTLTDDVTIEVDPGPADTGESVIDANDSSIQAGEDTTITVTLKDEFGNELESGGETVCLSTTLGGFDQAEECGDGGFEAEHKEGGVYTATFTSMVKGTATIEAAFDGDSTPIDDVTITVNPGPADAGQSDIDANDFSIQAGEDTTITATLKDEFGNELESGGETVCLSTDLGTFEEGQGSCEADEAQALYEGGGDYTATFTSTQVGEAEIEAFLGDESIGTASVVVNPGQASGTTTSIEADRSTITADGTDQAEITVTVMDEFGNVRTQGGDTVCLSTDPDLGDFAEDQDDCESGEIQAEDQGDGTGTYTAQLSSTQAGTTTVSGSVGAEPIDDEEQLKFTGLPEGIELIVPGPVQAGAVSDPFTIRALDDQGDAANVQEATTFTLSSDSGGTSEFYAGDDDTGDEPLDPPQVTIDTGQSEVTFRYRDTEAGTAEVTAADADGDGLGSASEDHEITPGPADAGMSTIDADKSEITADGNDEALFTVQVHDEFGNPHDEGGSVVCFEVDLADTGLQGQGTCPDNGDLVQADNLGDGTYTVRLSGTRAGQAQVTATLHDDSTGATIGTETVSLHAGEPDTATSEVEAQPDTIAANGQTEATITVRLLDAFGNALDEGGHDVCLQFKDPGDEDHATLQGDPGGSGCAQGEVPLGDNGDGTYEGTLTGTEPGETIELEALLDGDPISETATVTLVKVEPNHVTIDDGPATTTAGTTSGTFTIQVRGEAGEPTAVEETTTFSLSTDSDSDEAVFLDADTDTEIAQVTIPSGGGSVQFRYGDTLAGSAQITVTHIDHGTDQEDLGAETASIDVEPGPADPTVSTITADPDTITADGDDEATITIDLKDAFGNALTTGGDMVCTVTDHEQTQITDTDDDTACPDDAQEAAMDQEDGTYTATLTGTLAGTALVNATVNGQDLTQNVSVTLAPGPVDAIEIPTGLLDLKQDHDATQSVTFTVDARDANDNEVPLDAADDIEWTVSPTAGGSFDDNVFTPSDEAGEYTITATLQADSSITDTTKFTIREAEQEEEEEEEESNDPSPEPTRPEPVTDLQVRTEETTHDRVTLEWTAPADNGTEVATYRIAAAPDITHENFNDTLVDTERLTFDPDPLAAPNETQTLQVTGLTAGTTYRFAVVAQDDDGNRSEMRETGQETTQDAVDPVAANAALQATVSVRSVDEGIEITWDRDTVPHQATGMIVWRINSPASVADILQADDPAFDDARMIDKDGTPQSGYLLTLFYGLREDQGYNTQSLAQIAEFLGTDEEELVSTMQVASSETGAGGTDDGSAGVRVFWIVAILLLLVAAAGAAAFFVIRKRQYDAAHAPPTQGHYGDDIEQENWYPDATAGDPYSRQDPYG